MTSSRTSDLCDFPIARVIPETLFVIDHSVSRISPSAVVTNGCVKSLVRGSHVDTESGGRIGHIEDGESVAGSVGGLWAG